MQYFDYDFIGFTYKEKHSIKDLGIYRVSNGDRYEDNLLPTLQEKTASVEGMDGLYYFGTKVQQKQFNISFAFQELTEQQIRKIKETFNGDGVHDLIFDEHPYKAYKAKVTGSATMKYICDEKNGQRLYNGEGSLQFTCYYPYARLIDSLPDVGTITSLNLRSYYTQIEGKVGQYQLINKSNNKIELPCGILKSRISMIQVNSLPSLISTITLVSMIPGEGEEIITVDASQTPQTVSWKKTYEWVYIKSITYTLRDTSLTAITDNVGFMFTPRLSRTGKNYYYYSNGDKRCFIAENMKGNPKCINAYSLHDFPQKYQWQPSIKLFEDGIENRNIGDIPVDFTVTYTSPSTNAASQVSLKVGGNEITIDSVEEGEVIVWESKTGLVYKKTLDSKNNIVKTLISYTGNGCGKINKDQSGGCSITKKEGINGSLGTAVVDYTFLYY